MGDKEGDDGDVSAVYAQQALGNDIVERVVEAGLDNEMPLGGEEAERGDDPDTGGEAAANPTPVNSVEVGEDGRSSIFRDSALVRR